MNQKPYLHFSGISKSYVNGGIDHPVIEGFELGIEKGEFVSMIGQSGFG